MPPAQPLVPARPPEPGKLPVRDPAKEAAAAGQRDARMKALRADEVKLADALGLRPPKGVKLPAELAGEVNLYRERTFGSFMALSPDGSRIVVSELNLGDAQPSKELWYRIVDLVSGQQVCRFEVGTGGKCRPAFSPDGAILAIGSLDKEIVLWDTKTGAAHKRFKVSDSVWHLAYTPDGTGVFACLGGALVLLDPESGGVKRAFGDSSLHAAKVAVSPTGEVLAAVTRSPKKDRVDFVSLWDVSTGGKIDERETKGLVYGDLFFSPDGWTIYSHQNDSFVAWDLTPGTVRTVFEAKGASNLVLSPDGQRVASYSAPELVVHDLKSGAERRLRSLPAFWPDANPVFFRGGSLLATTSNSHFVVWKAAAIQPGPGK